MNVPMDCLWDFHPWPLPQDELIGLQAEVMEGKNLIYNMLEILKNTKEQSSFLSDPGLLVRSMCLVSVSKWVSELRLRHLVTIFWTNVSGAIWWPNLELIQVAPSGHQIWN
jgi:hypothetical protein